MNKNFFRLMVTALLVSTFAGGAPVLAEDVFHGGDIIYTQPIKAVIFSHAAHTEKIGLQCEWCHESTFKMEALKVQKQSDFNMESLCNENYCGICHNNDIAFSTTIQCARCHIGVKGYNELVNQGKLKPEKEGKDFAKTKAVLLAAEKVPSKEKGREKETSAEKKTSLEKMIEAGYYPKDFTMTTQLGGTTTAIFSHKKHSEREKLKCVECHPNVFVMKVGNTSYKGGQLTMAQMEKGKFCGTCHNGKKAFSVSSVDHCNICHSKQK